VISGVGPGGPGQHDVFPYVTPFGVFGLPWWIIAVVLGREAFMTIYRAFGASRGEIISGSRMGKWKTGFQWTWVGATFFWFAAATAAAQYHWSGPWWVGFAYFNGLVNVVLDGRCRRAHAVLAVPLPSPAGGVGIQRANRAAHYR